MELNKVIYFSLLIFISACSMILILSYLSYKIRIQFFGESRSDDGISGFTLIPMYISIISDRTVAVIKEAYSTGNSISKKIIKKHKTTFESKVRGYITIKVITKPEKFETILKPSPEIDALIIGEKIQKLAG